MLYLKQIYANIEGALKELLRVMATKMAFVLISLSSYFLSNKRASNML